MTTELLGPDQGAEEFILIVNSGDFNPESIARLGYLAGKVGVVERLANKYWEIQMKAERGEEKLEENPYYRAGQVLVSDFADIAAPPVKDILSRRYGLRSYDIDDLRNETIVEAYFKVFGYFVGSFSAGAVGRQFARPLSEFGGMSRLDLVRDGRFEPVIQHGRAGIIGGGT